MKRVLLFSLVLCGIMTSNSSNAAPASPKKFNDTTTAMPFIPDAHEMLLEIMNVTGLQPNFELKEADVNNIQASISHRKRYILYNPDYIAWINKITRNKWAAMTLLAHEVGHHLNGHTIRKGGSNVPVELEADEFAGFILYKLGATLEQAQEVMKYIAGKKDSQTHPARASRMEAIEKGWDKAQSEATAVVKNNRNGS